MGEIRRWSNNMLNMFLWTVISNESLIPRLCIIKSTTEVTKAPIGVHKFLNEASDPPTLQRRAYFQSD